MSRMGKSIKFGLMGVAMAALVACTAQYRNHGYVPLADDLTNIVVGIDTRDSVAETVGTPSTEGILDNSGYYYVRSRVRHYAYQAPKVIDREVVAITFDKRGVVSNIERYGLEDGKVVSLDRRVTDSAVANLSFLRQLLGSLGKFNAADFVE
ncbi:outer membrane protein assembly factor BamE [Thalassovita sp.]|jgi:outer membrane protein assembly factor BamE (lipoprotein component of BamABCDE complex)|uniref:outer membrane protein assembly factor BamE n=1 Tax=Thalassovita sp. TaxID=1979401 RepID=UPI003B58E7B3